MEWHQNPHLVVLNALGPVPVRYHLLDDLGNPAMAGADPAFRTGKAQALSRINRGCNWLDACGDCCDDGLPKRHPGLVDHAAGLLGADTHSAPRFAGYKTSCVVYDWHWPGHHYGCRNHRPGWRYWPPEYDLQVLHAGLGIVRYKFCGGFGLADL